MENDSNRQVGWPALASPGVTKRQTRLSARLRHELKPAAIAERRRASPCWQGSDHAAALENVLTQVLILEQRLQTPTHEARVHRHCLVFELGGVKRDFLEHLLYDSMQAPSANVLDALIHLERRGGELLQAVRSEFQAHTLHTEERLILAGQ